MKTRTVQLGEVATIDRRAATEAECTDLPFVGLEHIESNSGNFATEFKRRPEAVLATKFRFDKDHVLYGKLRPYLNKVALPEFDGVCTTEILPVLPKPGVIDRGFLYGLLLSTPFVRWASLRVSGANLPRLDPSTMEEFSFVLPSLSEQKRIAGLLEQADRLRRTRRYALELSDTFLPAAFLSLFGDPKVNPKNWPHTYLAEVCDPRQWPTISGNEILERGYPVYGANGKIGCYSEFNHEHPTVLLTCRGATCGTINVCEPKSYVTGNAMCLDEPDTGKITIDYLAWVLRLRGVSDAITGSAQPQITRQTLEKVGFPLPPLEEQHHFAALVARHERLRAALRETLRQAEHLFQSLLHRAFCSESGSESRL